MQGAYNPPGYAQPQYDQYYQQYPPLPPQYQQQQQDDDESTDVMVMTLPAQSINHSAFRSMFKSEKLSGSNFNDWFRSLKLVLRVEKKLNVIEQPILPSPAAGSTHQAFVEWNTIYDAHIEFGESDGGGELGGGGGEGDGVLNWTSSGVIGKRSIEDDKVPLVDDVFKGELGALGFRNGSSSGCHGGLWWLIENEQDDEVVERHIVVFERSEESLGNPRQEGVGVDDNRSRKAGMIWSFVFLGVCKRTKIPFVCEYGLTDEWDYEDLIELLERERESDEFVLNHEGDKNDAGVISLKSDLTIKV
ncbi:hypothetical protein Tco_0605671 [Tanacetum coccineum]